MIAQFDIFKQESEGEHRWVESAMNLEAAKARIKALGSAVPGEYVVLNQRTGNRVVIRVAEPDVPTHISGSKLRPALEQILMDAIEKADADFGNLQLLDTADGALKIVVYRGFSDEFLRFFGKVYLDEACACGRVLKERKRVMISDVMCDPIFDKSNRNTLLKGNVRAVQSMPLSTREHQLMGVLSVHYRDPRISIGRQTAISDSFLTNAADLIRTGREV